MRPLLKLYIALIAVSAIAVLAYDLMVVPESPHPWSWALLLSLTVLCVVAEHMQFQVARSWFSTAGAVAAIASALLLPTGLSELVLVVGAATRLVRVPQAPPKCTCPSSAPRRRTSHCSHKPPSRTLRWS